MGTAKLTPTTVSDSQHQPLWDDALKASREAKKMDWLGYI